MPDGPQLRLQLLELSSLEWLPTKTMFPMQSQMARSLVSSPADRHLVISLKTISPMLSERRVS